MPLCMCLEMHNNTQHVVNQKIGESGQDGRVGKRCTFFLSQPHQNYNETTEQPLLGVA